MIVILYLSHIRLMSKYIIINIVKSKHSGALLYKNNQGIHSCPVQKRSNPDEPYIQMLHLT